MTGDEALAPKALPAGSRLWWALLFSEPDRRPAVRALLAVRGELRHAAMRVGEPAVAAAKLAWWRDEARRYGSGREQHPATRALAASAGGRDVEPEYLEELVDAAEMDAAHRPYGGFSEVRLYAHRSSGVLHELIATLAGFREPANERRAREAAHRIGIGARLAEIACGVRGDLTAGRVYLPVDWLEEARVGEADLAADPVPENVRICLTRMARAARSELSVGLGECPDRERDRQRAAAVVAALALADLEAAESRDWAPAPDTGLSAARTSLRNLATAWGAARQAMRVHTENS